MKRGEIWWADLGAIVHTNRPARPVIVWQSDTPTRSHETASDLNRLDSAVNRIAAHPELLQREF